MKRVYFALGIVFPIWAGVAFGAESGRIETLSWKLEASATSTYGYDLEELRGGFRNRASAGLTVTVLPKRSVATDGERWYGRIEVKDFELTVTPAATRGAAGRITADVTNDTAFMRIFSAPRARIANFAAALARPDVAGPAPIDPATRTAGAGEQGLIFGYGAAAFNDLSASIFSFGDWLVDDPHSYGAVLRSDLSVRMFDLKAGAGIAPFGDQVDSADLVLAYGGEVGIRFGSYRLAVAADATNLSAADPELIDGRTAFADMATSLTWEEGDTEAFLLVYLGELALFELDDDDAADDQLRMRGFAPVVDLDVGFIDEERIPNVKVGSKVGLYNLLVAGRAPVSAPADEEESTAHPGYPLTLSLGLDLAYGAGGLNPFAGAETRVSAYGRSFGIRPFPLVRPGLDLTAGLALGPALHRIAFTTFTVKYEARELLNESERERLLTVETKIVL